MSDPAWFKPGTVVRLKPTLALGGDYPATAVLRPNPGASRSLFYPSNSGRGCYVRPEHVEPVDETDEPNYKRRYFL